MPEPSGTEGAGKWNTRFSNFGRWLKKFLDRFRKFTNRHRFLKIFFKIFVTGIGFLIILAGIAMLVLPGPGWLTIFFGLAILGTEFVWPRKILSWLRRQLTSLKMRFDNYRKYRRELKKRESDG